jgi:hypothetical protein
MKNQKLQMKKILQYFLISRPQLILMEEPQEEDATLSK